MEVFLTGVKYRLYQSSYYTAINKYSDLTPDESSRMLSGAVNPNGDGVDTGVMDDKEARDMLLNSIAMANDMSPNDLNAIEDELKRERAVALSKIKRRRRKRSTKSSDNGRNLKVDDLIKLPPDPLAKINTDLNIQPVVPPENPDYDMTTKPSAEGSQIEDQIEDIPEDQIPDLEKSVKNLNTESRTDTLGAVRSALNGVVGWFSSAEDDDDGDTSDDDGLYTDDEDEEDELVVIRDWRTTGCIGQPIDQRYCAR